MSHKSVPVGLKPCTAVLSATPATDCLVCSFGVTDCNLQCTRLFRTAFVERSHLTPHSVGFTPSVSLGPSPPTHRVPSASLWCLLNTLSSPSSNSRSRLARSPYSIWQPSNGRGEGGGRGTNVDVRETGGHPMGGTARTCGEVDNASSRTAKGCWITTEQHTALDQRLPSESTAFKA